MVNSTLLPTAATCLVYATCSVYAGSVVVCYPGTTPLVCSNCQPLTGFMNVGVCR
jgi:hypothetical protein